ncbi:Txe/YoeB family addiction module toxin [Aestuariivirga sp.]|uniref:Txe/YoeB family addiction module toxin n=1 Tax=Aestuariivirga sp. TaxID=2650926 RepID=UPI003BAB05AB
MKLLFSGQGWEDYLFWQANDRTTLERINALIKDASRNPFQGIGKPEPLRGELSGWWSRRITQEHRLVYRAVDGTLQIAQCRYHY